MKKLNITKEQFEKSKYFKDKYGKLEYVSESGKMFKTDKGKILRFKESHQKGEHLYSVIVKKPGGWDGSFQVYAMSSDEALEKARAKIGRGSKILRIEDIGEYKTDKGKFRESTKKFGKKFMKEERKSDPKDMKKHEYEEKIYDDLYDFLKDKDYVLDVDALDVPIIVTTNEGYCFFVKVEPCEYDWDEKDIVNFVSTGDIKG